jgi:GH24 family phage-related lysozyme (muramidase)
MAYSLKFVLDTFLKQNTAQSSQLSEDQRQLIRAGAELPIVAVQPVEPDHLQVSFGQDAQGKQIFFKGRNTWYVYRPAVQVLRDGLPITTTPAQTGRPATSYVLKAVLDTWLKQSTQDSATLPDSQRQFFKAGTVLPIASYKTAPNNHLQITFGKKPDGKQLVLKGRNTWFVFRPAIQVLRDGKVVVSGTAPTIAPPQRRQINSKGIQLLKAFEGLSLTAYRDAVGVWTIGYGTTLGVRPGMTITVSQAEALLKRDLLRFETAVATGVKVAINDDQFSALVVFSYNVGEKAFTTSTLLKLLNQGNYQGAANELLRWNRAGGRVLAGLTRRRRAERALFLGQDYTAYL